MVDRNILAIHDRIDEEHFEVHLLKSTVRALLQRVIILESQIRELRRVAFDVEDEYRGENGRSAESDPRRSRTATGR
jgi:hypothetical protein